MFTRWQSRICALLILAVGAGIAASTQSPASPRPGTYINSFGQPIPTIFSGVRADKGFTDTIASASRRASTQRLQSLVYGQDCPKRSLQNIALKNAAGLQDNCYGEYMEPQLVPCSHGCGGHSYTFFYSTGEEPCNGYTYGPKVCEGCNTQEVFCLPEGC
jgi:hypothetical protein